MCQQKTYVERRQSNVLKSQFSSHSTGFRTELLGRTSLVS
uniref:Uncharacterized protein n=1 Tax=Anguilla anguilla TaxID=7936 RepID=A0A0E9T0D1_ANGAN